MRVLDANAVACKYQTGLLVYARSAGRERMQELGPDEVAQEVKDLFNKGFTALERGNPDYAIDLFTRCIDKAPGFLQGRRYLRVAQIQRFKRKQSSKLTHLLTSVTGNSMYMPAKAMLKAGKHEQALEHAEKLMALDPLNKRFVHLFAEAAAKAGLPTAAVQTLEIVRESYPNDVELMLWLGSLHLDLGNATPARECFERLAELKPNDPAILRSLKNATALESLSTDWKDSDDLRGKIKDTKEALILEQKGKAVKTDKDLDDLIEDTRQKIANEPGNVNYYRELARLLVQRRLFEQAVETLRQVIAQNPGDPELEAALSGTYLQSYDQEIASLRASGDGASAEAKQAERDEYAFNDLQDRVTRYPNDLKLRYEFGVMLYTNNYVDQAIQQFQLSQRSPKYRESSLYYLGLAFRRKEQYDLAIGQMETAAGEIVQMSDLKKAVLYELGEMYEIVGKAEKAAESYKQVYQVDIGYRDIVQKVERGYKR
jgi:tetratricopeptide (TPR) repeat protein